MSTRQYIGARYVPKFYINANDGSSLWQDNVIYEPLTWVTRPNFRMYISRKTVPATIGAPEDNIEYWLEVGQFNGYITDLQNRITSLSSDLTTAEGNITTLQGSMTTAESDITALQGRMTTAESDITSLKSRATVLENATLIGKQIAVYGDSWADPTNVYSGWVDKLSTYSGKTAHNNSVSGRTFAQIDSAFDNYNADVYIVQGGVNDWNGNLNPGDVATSINSIISKIRAVNADAEIIFVTPIANLNHSPNYTSIYSVYPLELYRQVIWQCAENNHVMVASGLKMSNVRVGDGLHPVVADAVKIADCIIKSYAAGGDSRDYHNEFAWIDSSKTVYCLAESGSFRLVGDKTITFTAGVGSWTNNYFNLSTCFLVGEQTSLTAPIADGTFIVRTGLNSTGLAFNGARVSDGAASTVNGGLPLHFNIPLTFLGTIPTVTTN